MRTVAIVGAGPSGLVAAKTLIHTFPTGTFDVTIFEQKHHVGGMWPMEKDDYGGAVNPNMPTNLSRFTVAFSDLAWENVTPGDSEKQEQTRPMFPKAWQVGQYLKEYAKKYIPKECVRLGSRVTHVERVNNHEHIQWKIDWTHSQGGATLGKISDIPLAGNSSSPAFFDNLIVASGFFYSPLPLGCQPPTDALGQSVFSAGVQHSSHYRRLSTLLPEHFEGSGNIVVVGGSMSGAEAAAAVAFEISNSRYSPTSDHRFDGLKVYHVTSRPFYSLPRYLPLNPGNRASTFAPLDLCMYNLSRRPEGPISAMNGFMLPEKAKMSHQYIQSIIGGGQGDLGSSAITFTPAEQDNPAYVAISDNYADFVRSGDVIPIEGRATGLGVHPPENNQGKEMPEAFMKVTSSSGKETIVEKVAGVISATGYSPFRSIEWLSKEIRDILEYDERCHRLPIVLEHHGLWNSKIPGLAFVGFYEGPYWGVMEMQARVIARKWATTNESEMVTHDCPSDDLQKMRTLREALLRNDKSIPQFWMGDYVGLMEGFARELDLKRNDSVWNGQKGPCFPARYLANGADESEANIIIQDLNSTADSLSSSPLFVAAAAFRAMQGAWVLNRQLDSRLVEFPSGKFEGTAHFHPRNPTDPEYDAEYLYVEQGSLTTEMGLTLQAKKRYVYRYCANTDKISAWFVKDDGFTVDSFFNEMEFHTRTVETDQVGSGWLFKGYHLCSQDNYNSFGEFIFKGVGLEKFSISYRVKGPKKDYTSESWYQRA